ncbi:MAG TPA: type II secretion system F family protein [Trinickia sp.]|nr:type II secretion system F family protein [Trinickia sp.]
MSKGSATLAACALLFLALALLLWQRGARAQRRIGAQRFIDSRLAASGATVAGKGGAATTSATASLARMAQGVPPANAHASPRPGKAASPTAGDRRGVHQRRWPMPSIVENLVVRAGLADAGARLAFAFAALALALVWIGWRAGAVAAFAAAIGAAAIVAVLLTARAQRRRLAIIVQLPTFLDGIVRLVTLGNSIPAAFQAALQTTEAPLRECLDHVSRMMRAGVEIDRALAHVAALYGTREFEFVGAVLRLSVKYGGRADVMLERMAAFMRDLEQAERELGAMSAETRLSAWVLVALPLAIGAFLIANNPAYFSAMWSDPDGRHLIYLAFALQAGGGYLLYRMTRLRT